MSFIRDFALGPIRSEMKNRTTAIMNAMKDLNLTMKNNTRALNRKFGSGGGNIPEGIKQELKDNFSKIVEQESTLIDTLNTHMDTLNKILEKL